MYFELIQNENNNPGSDVFNDKFYQTFMKEIVPILHKLLQKIKKEEYF